MIKGQELDDFVARIVMGWAIHHRNTACYVPKAFQNGIMPVSGGPNGSREIDNWRPSSNIKHAFEVVEKMAGYDETSLWWNYTAGSYCCVPGYDMTLSRILFARPEDFPHAICIAALDAMGFPPNVRDHRAGPSDSSKAGQAIVAGSGASTCWADAQSTGETP